MIRAMRIRAAVPLLALHFALALPSFAFTFQQLPQGLLSVPDVSLREEIARLGPYAESDEPLLNDSMDHTPLRSFSTAHLEFATADVRVRVEAFPFERGSWVKVRRDGRAWLEDHPLCTWGNEQEHLRLGRVEVVVDGSVCTVPAKDVLDVFDPVALRADRPEHWCLVARSKDGYRLYVQVLAGAGAQARVITWTFENGRYLFRVVDPYDEG